MSSRPSTSSTTTGGSGCGWSTSTASGQDAVNWAERTRRSAISSDQDAILAIATGDRAYALQCRAHQRASGDSDALRRNAIEPATARKRLGRRRDSRGQRAQHGIVADVDGFGFTWVGMLVVLAIIAVAVLVLWLWSAAASPQAAGGRIRGGPRVDPADPSALAAVPIDALDDLSKSIVVDVDNAVRTSDNELALAVEEFGDKDTAPFSRAVATPRPRWRRRSTCARSSTTRYPRRPQQRRDLLTRVVVAAAKADRELDAQREAFEQLRDLVINAPTRLDALTQQMVDLTARIEPSEQALAALHNQFADTALASVAGNVETAKQRLAFADQNITNARTLVSRPAGSQSGLVDAIRAAESALGQARTLLDARRQRRHRHQPGGRRRCRRPSPTSRTASTRPAGSWHRATPRRPPNSAPPETPRWRPSPTAQSAGTADPLGTFTGLTQADADAGPAAGQRGRGARSGRTPEPQRSIRPCSPRSRGYRAVSDFIDTRRGSIGPEARTRLAEAVRQLAGGAGQEGDATSAEAIAHANGAAMLAGAGAVYGERRCAGRAAVVHRPLRRWRRSDMGAVLGGIIIGNILRGGFSGGGLGGGSVAAAAGARRRSAARVLGRLDGGGGGRF